MTVLEGGKGLDGVTEGYGLRVSEAFDSGLLTHLVSSHFLLDIVTVLVTFLNSCAKASLQHKL